MTIMASPAAAEGAFVAISISDRPMMPLPGTLALAGRAGGNFVSTAPQLSRGLPPKQADCVGQAAKSFK
tara:strand:+ start:5324 stop:5530 length:207 start_codon:yes stop_codon:yes gene_type:complete